MIAMLKSVAVVVRIVDVVLLVTVRVEVAPSGVYVIDAVFVTVVFVAIDTVNVTLPVAPGASVPNDHCAAPVTSVPPPVADWNVVFAGIGSLRTTFDAVPAPVFE